MGQEGGEERGSAVDSFFFPTSSQPLLNLFSTSSRPLLNLFSPPLADLRRQDARVPQGVPSAPGAGLVLDRPRDGEAQDGHALVVERAKSIFSLPCLFFFGGPRVKSLFSKRECGERESTKSTNPNTFLFKQKRGRESQRGRGYKEQQQGGASSAAPLLPLSHPLSLRFPSS